MDEWKLIAHLHTEVGFARGVLEGLELQSEGPFRAVVEKALERLAELERARQGLFDGTEPPRR
jgi:hypothetical protein